jgi:hypothetical protein
MSDNESPPENKSYYGGIYSYFKQQKLKAKDSSEIQGNKGK